MRSCIRINNIKATDCIKISFNRHPDCNSATEYFKYSSKIKYTSVSTFVNLCQRRHCCQECKGLTIRINLLQFKEVCGELTRSTINTPRNKRPVPRRLRMQRGGGGHTFRKGDNFLRSSPTCSDSKEEVAHACGLSLKTRVQTNCSASGLVFATQNCKHISQSCVKKASLRIICNPHILRTAHAVRSHFQRNSFILSELLLSGPVSASSLLCLLNRIARTWLSSWHILSFGLLITTDYCQEPGNGCNNNWSVTQYVESINVQRYHSNPYTGHRV